ncbi:hypothetical protein V6Z11_D12G009300 [Gossypium hirsutum]
MWLVAVILFVGERSFCYIQVGLLDVDRLNNMCSWISSEAGYVSN